MNMDQLKTDWQRYNQKLELSQQLNEKLILSMIKERSRSRITKIRRDSVLFMILMTITLGFLTAIFAGNPFDFKYTLQYFPYAILATGVLLSILSLLKSLQNFNVNINNVSLDTFLKKIIDGYEKNKKMETWFGIIIMCAGALTALSFFPNKLENKPLLQALVETAVSMGVAVVIYFAAFKSGVFKNRKKEGFENDLKELNELKTLSSELGDI